MKHSCLLLFVVYVTHLPGRMVTCQIGTPNLCPSGWKEFDGHCYRLYKEGVDWEEARNLCMLESSHLVSIHSQEESDFVVHEVARWGGYLVWLGLKRVLDSSDEYEWEDKSAFDYANWDSDEPDHKGDCFLMGWSGVGSWAETYCSFDLNYICKSAL